MHSMTSIPYTMINLREFSFMNKSIWCGVSHRGVTKFRVPRKIVNFEVFKSNVEWILLDKHLSEEK